MYCIINFFYICSRLFVWVKFTLTNSHINGLYGKEFKPLDWYVSRLQIVGKKEKNCQNFIGIENMQTFFYNNNCWLISSTSIYTLGFIYTYNIL
jgi:hypothetical protein